jgi:hypothetical protein
MAEVVHTLTSADGRLRVEVVRRPTGGYQGRLILFTILMFLL